MSNETSPAKTTIDAEALREQVKLKYREVASSPDKEFHFHTGRLLTQRLKYDQIITSQLPDHAVESFAGVGNPFSLRPLRPGEKVVDLGSGSGFDCFVASTAVGSEGQVVGVDMTEEMLSKATASAREMKLDNVEFREGLLEDLPLEDGWADVAISNGVINLCSDKQQALAEIKRVLKPGGYLQFADIANSKPVPQAAIENIDLWTAWIAGGLPCAGWEKMLSDAGFVDIVIGPGIDTFAGASGETNAREFGVLGYAFLARKPI